MCPHLLIFPFLLLFYEESDDMKRGVKKKKKDRSGNTPLFCILP